MPAHLHALSMSLYAEDAKETATPWKRWQYKEIILNDRKWSDCVEHPGWFENTEYRRKPTKKAVDLSVLISSGIDCTLYSKGAFHPGYEEYTGPLADITPEGYETPRGAVFAYCTPRLNHWHPWLGGECPVPAGLRVEAMYRDSMTAERESTSFRWYHWDERDIIAFRIVSLQDGYCWPWETEE